MTAGAFNRPRLLVAGAFLGLLAITVVARFPSFLLSVVDWDESVYLLISRGLLEGQAPYTGIFDHKPPGIYALFALAQLVFGQSVTAIRILSCLAVAATALVVAALARFASGGSRLAAAAAGVLYATLSATMGGLAANTEIFFVLPGAAALLVLARWRPGEGGAAPDRRRVLLAGLVAGAGPQIKALAGVDLVAVLVAIAWKLRHDSAGDAPAPRGAVLRLLAVATASYLVPTALTVLAFALTGHLGAYVRANLTANVTYAVASGSDAGLTAAELVEVVRSLWLPALATAAAALALAVRGRRALPSPETPVVVWLLGGLAAVLVTRLVYPHYLLQVLPPLCVLGGVTLGRLAQRLDARARYLGAVVAAVLLVAAVKVALTPIVGLGTFILHGRKLHADPLWADGAAQMAAAIAPSLAPGEQVWSVDCQPVVYYLLDVVVPSRFVVPSQLTDPRLLAMTGADVKRELVDALSRCPRYVLRGRSSGRSELHETLDAVTAGVYELDVCRGNCCAYRLKDRAEATLLRRVAALSR